MAYECAAYLASSRSGPLYNSIKILDQNNSNSTIITASSWIDFSRCWFSEGGIYSPNMAISQHIINIEVENYYSAFIETCNHSDWDDGKKRWNPQGNKKSLLEMHGPSNALLRIYPQYYVKHAQISSHHLYLFLDQRITAIKWVDWTDSRLIRKYMDLVKDLVLL